MTLLLSQHSQTYKSPTKGTCTSDSINFTGSFICIKSSSIKELTMLEKKKKTIKTYLQYTHFQNLHDKSWQACLLEVGRMINECVKDHPNSDSNVDLGWITWSFVAHFTIACWILEHTNHFHLHMSLYHGNYNVKLYLENVSFVHIVNDHWWPTCENRT